METQGFKYGEALTDETLRLQEEEPEAFKEFIETGLQLEKIAGFIVKTRGMRTRKEEAAKGDDKAETTETVED